MDSRIETLLKALLNGDSVNDFTPQSRAEHYLKNCILKIGVEGLPDPQSRLDALLYLLAEKMPESGGESLPTQTKTITPSTSEQSVSPDSGYKLTKVIVQAVTNAIDANIKAENIKEGVSILGVAGTEKGFDAGKKEEREAFWTIFQNYGNQRSYYWAFGNSAFDDETYNPIYPIVCSINNEQSSSNMFRESRLISDTKVEIKASSKNISYCFLGAKKLETIRKITVYETTIFTSAFQSCELLKNIEFGGTIGQSISFSDSPYLTAASAENIIKTLKSYNEDPEKNGVYSLTFHSETWNELNKKNPPTGEDGTVYSSWEEYVDLAKGWSV